jgi:hypothetical protein
VVVQSTFKKIAISFSGKFIKAQKDFPNNDSLLLSLYLLQEKYNPKSFWTPFIGRGVERE